MKSSKKACPRFLNKFLLFEIFVKIIFLFPMKLVMYKTRNTGTGNGMWGKRVMGGMLYSGDYRQTFREMSSNIPGNVFKHSDECSQTFRGMSSKFRGISSNIPGNVDKHSGECCQTFRGMPVLLKEMWTKFQCKISFCFFYVWCKSRELRGREVQDSLV